MNYYKISTADFAKQTAEVDLIKVVGDFVYLQSKNKLKKPFVSVTNSEMPLEVVEALNELETQLNAIRTAKLAELDNARDAYISSGVEYNGVAYDSDTQSQILLSQAISRYTRQGEVPEGFLWIAKDNSLNALKLADLIELEGKMAERLYTAYIKANKLKSAVRDSIDLGQIQSVVW